MTTRFCTLLAALSLAVLPAIAGAQDPKGSKDHPLFARLPGFRILTYDEKQLAVGEFDDGKNPVKVDGRRYDFYYQLDAGAAAPSPVQIVRSFTDAVEHAGGKVLRDRGYAADMMLAKNGTETWVHLEAENGGKSYKLKIIEKAAARQDVFATVAAIVAGLEADGHVTLGGIFFDAGKAEVKPESEAALAEVATLMAKRPALRLRVIGHTDNEGDFAANQKLSQARAEAVVAYLVSKHQVDAKRLSAHGIGSLSPVVSNATEEGRFRNRRVEVAQY